MKFDLDPANWELVESLLIQPLKAHGAKVWVFGSRATKKNKKFSDLDILFSLSKPLPQGFLFKLKDALEESHLPIKVDVVNEAELAESYKNDVLRDRVPV